MSRRLPFVPTLVAIVIALAVAAVAAAGWRSDTLPGSPRLEASAEHMKLSQTLGNQALIKLPNAKPGQIAKGATVLRVSGRSATVTVQASDQQDVAGPNGGRLIASKRLWIDVRCAGTPCPRSPLVYRGPLSQMGTRTMGMWPPGTRRTYAVRVWLLRGGRPPTGSSGDNAFQGSKARFGLVWTATAP